MEVKKNKEVENRYIQLNHALIRLDDAIECYEKHINSEELCLRRLIRDGLIQNYEFSIEIFWKFLNIFLRSQGRKIISDNGISTFREAESAELISQEEFNQLAQLISDRNETSHIYREPLAIAISERIPAHYIVMAKILDRIKL